MKKTLILATVFLNLFTSLAQEIPFEKLEALSKKISQSQLEVDGKIYNDGTTDYQISFTQANFTVAFNSQLASNAVYKKSNGTELLYLTENFSLARTTGITIELIDNNIVLYNLHFGKFTVTTKNFKNGELVDTTYKNNLILYAKYNGNETNSMLYNAIFELSTLNQIYLGLIKKEKLDIENKDWLNLTKEDFIKKHPNSIRTMLVKKDMAKKVERTTLFLDSISNAFKIKIGMTEEEYKQQNPLIAEELFKKKNIHLANDGNSKSYYSLKKFPQFGVLDFESNKLIRISRNLQFNSNSDRTKQFEKYKSYCRVNLSPKHFKIIETGGQHTIFINHPNEHWNLSFSYRPDLDPYSYGILLNVVFRKSTIGYDNWFSVN
jgi:hypothetical protein